MEKHSIPLLILLCLLILSLGFIVGATLAGVLGMAEGQGLAGGAVIATSGVAGAIVGLVLAVIVGRKLSRKSLEWACLIVLLLNALTAGITYHRYQIRQAERENTAIYNGNRSLVKYYLFS